MRIVLPALIAGASGLALRGILAREPYTAPDLIYVWLLGGYLLRGGERGPFPWDFALATLLFLVGVAVLAALVAPRSRAAASLAALAAALVASVPTIDGLTVFFFEAPGMLVGSLVVYGVATILSRRLARQA